MSKNRHNIVVVHITDRLQHVPKVQSILTQYGCLIKTRLGLHELSADVCSPNGILLLELVDDEKQVGAFVGELNSIEGVEVKRIVFDHP